MLWWRAMPPRLPRERGQSRWQSGEEHAPSTGQDGAEGIAQHLAPVEGDVRRARTGEPGPRGISAFAVSANLDGISFGKLEEKLNYFRG